MKKEVLELVASVKDPVVKIVLVTILDMISDEEGLEKRVKYLEDILKI